MLTHYIITSIQYSVVLVGSLKMWMNIEQLVSKKFVQYCRKHVVDDPIQMVLYMVQQLVYDKLLYVNDHYYLLHEHPKMVDFYQFYNLI